jgi:hypothetical protein
MICWGAVGWHRRASAGPSPVFAPTSLGLAHPLGGNGEGEGSYG